MRWLRKHANEYGVNPNAIGVMGSSAGGHLAECLATMQPPARHGEQSRDLQVQAVVSVCGPSDLTAEGPPRSLYFREKLLGFSLRENPKAFKDASPIYFARSGDPPFLLLHGEMDDLVPIVFAERFVETLKQANVVVKLVRVKNAGHGLSQVQGAPPMDPSEQQLNHIVGAFLDRTLKR